MSSASWPRGRERCAGREHPAAVLHSRLAERQARGTPSVASPPIGGARNAHGAAGLHPRKADGRPGAAVMAAGFYALSPFAVFYGIEARNYATLMFLTVLSALIVLKATLSTDRRWWAAYAVTATAILYTHYTGAFVLAAEGLWVLLYHPRRWRSLASRFSGRRARILGMAREHRRPGHRRVRYARHAHARGVREGLSFLADGLSGAAAEGCARGGPTGPARGGWRSVRRRGRVVRGEAWTSDPSDSCRHRAGGRPRIRHAGQPARVRDLQR